MNQMNPAPENGAAKQGAPAPGAGQDSPAAGAPAAAKAAPAQAGAAAQAGASAQVSSPTQAGRATAVAGPFTVRDLLVFASALILFVASLLPLFGPYNLWNVGNLFFLGLGIILPVVVAGLFVSRRLQPQYPLRIGSLSVDQFASVVASFSVALYFLSITTVFSAYLLLGLVGALALLAGTVLAPHIPILRDDFKGRAESAAHPVARDAVAPFRKPAAPKPAAPKPAQKAAGPAVVPAAAAPVAGASAPGSPFPVVPAPAASAAPPASVAPAESRTEAPEGGTPAATPEPQAPGAAPEPQAPAAARQDMPATMAHPVVDRAPDRGPETAAYPQAARPVEPIGATVDPASRPEEPQEQAYEAFWFAVPQPRVAVDEHSGAPAFTIEPGGWVLALEDRGEEFLVQNTDGRLGVLRDLSQVERG